MAEEKGGYAKAMDEDYYRRQRELLTEVLREQDVVITTAAVPGKRAPILITQEMVAAMAAGRWSWTWPPSAAATAK